RGRMARVRIVRAVRASSAPGSGRALTPVVTMYAPVSTPITITVRTNRPSVRRYDLVFIGASLSGRHHRQTHLRIGEERVTVLDRTEVIRLPLIHRGCRCLRIEA